MKAIQYILTVAALMLCLTGFGQVKWDAPQLEWKSTSTMVGSGSSLPMAAKQGVMTTYNPESNNPPRPHVRRVTPGSNSGDPGAAEETPVGNAILPLLLLGIVYIIMKRKKKLLMIVLAFMSVSTYAEGYETLANLTGTTGITGVTNFTGDNGMAWTAVGATDASQTLGGYKALTVQATVSGNGLTGNLTTDQKNQGVGIVRFHVISLQPGTGYGNRTFRVTAGSKSSDVVVNIPKMNVVQILEAQLDAIGASQISISAVPNTADETITFSMYNITWTSFDGKTYPATFSTDAEFVTNGTDTTYYTEDNITVRFSSAMENATFYYTIDGSTPSTSSSSASSIQLSVGNHTVNVIAWTSEFGLSDVSTKVIKVANGSIHVLDGIQTDLEGKFGTVATGLNDYRSKTGLPFYIINKTKSNLISKVAVHPIGFSFYAYAINNKNITIAYQTGTYVYEGADVTWQTDDNWVDITTLSNPSDAPLSRYEIVLPNEIKNNAVKIRLLSSGNTIYIDDITTIDQASAQVEMPTFSHASGTLEVGTNVTITPVSGSTLHYSLNGGTEQTSTSAVVLTISSSTMVDAYATQEGKPTSWTARAQYTVSGGTVGVDNTAVEVKAKKLLRDGQVLILRNGEVYTVTGMRL